jgi:hypothetical protein
MGASQTIISGRSRRGCIVGIHRSPKCRKAILFKSKLELYVCKYLDSEPKVECYVYEPHNLRIPYVKFYGRLTKRAFYYPDFLIKYSDGHQEIWEVKPASQCNDKINRCKWAYAIAFCNRCNIAFRVITESVIRSLIQ